MTDKVSARSPERGPRKIYIYQDDHGEPVFRVIRRPGKKFHQERYVNGSWISGLGDTPRVLYHLPEVLKAAEGGRVVWVTEGEKDADALIAHGVIATTNPMGAGRNKWHDEYSHALIGCKRAIIVYDNDEEGHQHALNVEASLSRVGVSAQFRRAMVGSDASDHLDAGHALDELIRERPTGAAVSSNGDRPHLEEVARTAEPAVYQLAMIRLQEHAQKHGLPQPRQSATGWEACCPAHDDRSPSLGVRVGDDHPIVFNCQAGCEWSDIADALNIDHRDVSDHKPPEYDEALLKEIQRLRVNNEAKIVIAAESAPVIAAPTISPEQYMSEEAPEHPYTIDELHIQGANTLIVAQFKVGKSTMAINLYRSLVNVEPFLGKFNVAKTDGKVAYLDYEMLESQFRVWLQAGGKINTSRMVAPWHLRGNILAFWTKSVRSQLVEWLAGNNVKALIIDTAARAWAGLVENENSNSEILKFTDALDTLKAEAGVQDLFLITHMGRQSPFMAEGEERSRGATRLEDWMDTGWYLTRNKEGQRFLRANGRGVDVDPMVLSYTPNTRELTTTGVLKRESDQRTADEQVVDTIMIFAEPPTTNQLKDALPGHQNDKSQKLLGAEARGLIERRKGNGRTMLCYVTELGRSVHERRVGTVGSDNKDHLTPLRRKRRPHKTKPKPKQPEPETA